MGHTITKTLAVTSADGTTAEATDQEGTTLTFPSEIAEEGDTVVLTATVTDPKGMPKTAGLEGVERTSLTEE